MSGLQATVISSLRRRAALIFSVAFALALLAGNASAQFYFGKNKVNYTRFDWQVMTTEHFHIYFYTEGEEIAKIAAYEAEKSYEELAIEFNHEVDRYIPLIIYSAPNYFSQTNILPQLIPEAVAGFTEFLKGRVVVPFHGSYHDFAHVIKHELVHVFTLSKLSSVVDRQARIRYSYPPLWFTEGIAEYWSKEWDTEADMIIKDMVVNNHLPSIDQLWVVQGTYFMYKLGESICTFIDTTYGEDKLLLLFENWHKGRSFDEVVQITLGDNLKEVSRKWEYSLKKKYFPEISDLDLPRMEAERLTPDGYAVKGVPIRWDDGDGEKDWIVFKANRVGYSGIYMKPANSDRNHVKTLIKGERSSKFESLYLLRSGIDANSAGKIVFSSKSREKDVINLYDLREGKVTNRYGFDHLVAARSPRLSPDGRRVVFSGMEISGFSNLYLLDLGSGDLTALTHDVYYDVDPTFTLDGDAVIFSSDRCSDGPSGSLNLYRLDLASGGLSQITYGPFKDQSPEVSESGIYFSSDREGSFNLFLLADDGSMTRQSTYLTGAFDPRLSPDGKRLTFTGYQDGAFQVYQMKLIDDPAPVAQTIAPGIAQWAPKSISRKYSASSIKYDTDYSFDIAQSLVVYDPVYGSAGGLQVALSDILGNHVYYLLLTNTAETKDEILSSFNVGLTYINQERHLNWGLGFIHLYDEYYNDFDQYYDERQAGVITFLSYPVSKFQRIELTNYARYDKKDRRYGLVDREGFLLTNYVRWVYDNSFWDISGPIEGRRYNITLGLTTSLTEGRNYNRQALVDIRHYFRLGRVSAFANRMFGFTSTGLEPQRIYFGGSWSFRGYDRREWYARNVIFMSNELRFPLIDNLYIGFPIGGLGFRGIRGALFFDTGSAWDKEFDQLYGSFGFGFRVSLGYVLLLRFDFARTTDFEEISPDWDFDFFFGWNF
ncbi:hypothetical protein KQH51_04755 [bacterium]|nr:hypothetical protein [bacterium]MCB2202226.1 hypothetical protein [bacterium]